MPRFNCTSIPLSDDRTNPHSIGENDDETPYLWRPGWQVVDSSIEMELDQAHTWPKSEDMALPDSVLSSLKNGGPRRTDLRTFRWEVLI